ncbi:hypothetical protein Bca52824_025430 [Brassica carinata]|uniref:Uncharacterized protein n=1 Tax=Brassica carinata TaxID=52824 RepID=A0A8X7SGN6_BRACI|nr:hypothetical protein Bca52824_025430 [Brassica carinata]
MLRHMLYVLHENALKLFDMALRVACGLRKMVVKPTVALRGILVGGVAIFAKVAGAMKAAGGVKLGAAATAMTVAATAAVSGSKQDQKDDASKKTPPSK